MSYVIDHSNMSKSVAPASIMTAAKSGNVDVLREWLNSGGQANAEDVLMVAGLEPGGLSHRQAELGRVVMRGDRQDGFRFCI